MPVVSYTRLMLLYLLIILLNVTTNDSDRNGVYKNGSLKINTMDEGDVVFNESIEN